MVFWVWRSQGTWVAQVDWVCEEDGWGGGLRGDSLTSLVGGWVD